MQTKRLYFIDAVRAFAIIMMLQGHFIDALLNPIYRDNNNVVYLIWQYFRGITSPTFFLISGLVFTYLLMRANEKNEGKERIKKGLIRGALLIVLGYLIRLNIFNIIKGDFGIDLLVVDVLQCIGLSLILLIGFHYIFRKHTYMFSTCMALIGTLIFLCEPLYRTLKIDNFPIALSNYVTIANGSIFTIIPWFGYTAFGALIASIFFRHAHRETFKFKIIIAFFTIGLALMFGSTPLLHALCNVTNIKLFYLSAEYNYLFYRLGDVLVLFGIFYLFENYLKHSLITSIGQKTLSIYVIHFIILFGSVFGIGINQFYHDSLNPTAAIIGAIIFDILICVIAIYYNKTNHFFYKIIDGITKPFKL